MLHPENGNGKNFTKLLFWIMGSLLTLLALVGTIVAGNIQDDIKTLRLGKETNHAEIEVLKSQYTTISRQLDRLENNQGRLEGKFDNFIDRRAIEEMRRGK